MKDDNIT